MATATGDFSASHCACACRALLERARLKPADGRLRHAIGSRKIGLRSALSESLDSLSTLVGIEGSRTAEPNSTSLGAAPAVTGAGEDQGSLELGNAAQHRDQQLAMRRGGVGPGVGQRFEGGTSLADRIEDVEKVARGSRQAVEARHHHHIARLDEALFGWRGGKMAALYTQQANRKKLAMDAAGTLLSEQDANLYSLTSKKVRASEEK
jgi:hypothetical protein